MTVLSGTGVNPAGNYLEVCRLLIQSGAVLETPDTTYGRTAAHWAVYYHIADILVELILSGIAILSSGGLELKPHQCCKGQS